MRGRAMARPVATTPPRRDAAVRARLGADADPQARIAAAVQGQLWGMLHHSDFTAAHIRIHRYVSQTAEAVR
jgi:hypothetical protein